jgi:hypothetical protein
MTLEKPARRPRLQALGSAGALAAIVLGIALAISWPLWSLATGNRRAFTLAVGASAALSLAWLLARAAARRSARGRRGGRRLSP